MRDVGNPLATADTRALEARAIRVFHLPQVQAGKAAIKEQWRFRIGDDMTADGARCFDDFIDEYAFCYVLKAVNGDGNCPKVLTPIFAPPHDWMGLQVPGSRGGGSDSPDNSYSFMPIDYGPRYEISGRRHEPVPADTPYTLTDITFTKSLSHLDGPDLQVGPDGHFTITLDPEPANGRANHIQTKPDCRYVFNRESRSDWRQVPAGHTIRRLDPPTAPPLSDSEIAERALGMMGEGINPIYDIIKLWWSLAPNVIASPRKTGDFGGFVSQQFTMARLVLEDDEAFVVTIGHGGAGFRNFVAENFWLLTMDYWKITSSMNNSQGIPNADGLSTTYVVSLQDPGIHNWIDPAGLRQVNLIHRWQRLPRNSAGCGEPYASGILTKIGDLARHLPADMKCVTPQERATQLADRLATYKLRFAWDESPSQ